MSKICPEHGPDEVLVSSDAAYWNEAKEVPPVQITRTEGLLDQTLGCPLDCGVCSAHVGRISAVIIEIIDGCDLGCPTCIAGSILGTHGQKSPERVRDLLDQSLASIEKPDILFISGGEPALHERLFEILDLVHAEKYAERVFLITNGVRLANDPLFATRLADYPSLEVYLQFDSLRADALVNIRGSDLTITRHDALLNLADVGVSATLVCVSKRGVNLDESAAIVRFALKHPNVRGVTFQPIRDVGRLGAYRREDNSATLADVRNVLLESLIFETSQMVPHPLSPHEICIGYVSRPASLTDAPREITLDLLRARPEVGTMLFASPRALADAGFKDQDVLRIGIVEYLDRHNFTTRAAMNSCIAFVTNNGRLVPVDTYYLLYADAEAAAA